MEIRPMVETDRPAVLDLLEIAFGERDLFGLYIDEDPLFRWSDFLLAVHAGRPVSAVQVFEKSIQLRRRPVKLGGIGSVATHPDFRRRGLARDLMLRQTRAMRDRGMVIGLLFAGPVAFYQALGWVQTPLPGLAVHAAPASVALPEGVRTRPFAAADLPQIQQIYAEYGLDRSGTTLRDDVYWHGQLRYAGNPGEVFRVAERASGIVAYARGVEIAGATHAMEFAYARGETEALVSLILQLAPADAALLCRFSGDSGLRAALERQATRADAFEDPGPMWRVLDRATLASVAGVAEPIDDPSLLHAVLDDPPVHYWLSDRF